MFGPGTACRCARCTQLPDTCKWGRGPYAGTLLMYAQVLLLVLLLLLLLLMFLLQEMALNHMMTEHEYLAARVNGAVLDVTAKESSLTICQAALLHARHNKEVFSKVAAIHFFISFCMCMFSSPSCGASMRSTTCLVWT